MHILTNARIATKVVAMLLVLGALALATTLYGSARMREVNDGYTILVDSKLPATVQLIRMNRFASEVVQIGYRATAIMAGPADLTKAPADLDKAFAVATDSLGHAIRMDPALAGDALSIRTQLEGMRGGVAQALRAASNGDRTRAGALLSQADARLKRFGVEIVERNTARIKATNEMSAELSATAASTGRINLLVSLLSIALAIGGAILIVRKSITAPLGRLKQAMWMLAGGDTAVEVPGTARGDEVGTMAKTVLVFRDAAIEQARLAAHKAQADAEQKQVVDTVGRYLADLAKGDLTWTVDTAFPSNYERLRENLNAAVASLRTLIAAVSDSALHIRTGSNEIAQASEDLARRTESNAASLEETSAAIVEMDGRLKATASAAGRTVESADQTIRTVDGGRSVADQAVQAMGRVSESAKGIDDVIEGLDKIAFQTRVLAMNAAIEAGRAGEAGRGFAVVADLVSALAMRAEEEARRAREQLTLTQTDIGTAVCAVQNVDGALVAISGDVEAVHQLLATIASDNQAQASAISEVNAAVHAMDQSTQQNAAMVEQTSAAARNLSSEVAALVAQSEQFRVDRRSAAKPPRRESVVTAVKKAAACRIAEPEWAAF